MKWPLSDRSVSNGRLYALHMLEVGEWISGVAPENFVAAALTAPNHLAVFGRELRNHVLRK